METKLSVRLTPRASSNAFVRYENGVLFLRLTAPPVDGVANAACCVFVAELLGLHPGQVSVCQGQKSRDKTLLIIGLSTEALSDHLQCIT